MRPDEKRYLREYFEPPKARKKEAFCWDIMEQESRAARFFAGRRRLASRRGGMWNVARVQMRYISRGVWAGSAALFAVSLLLSGFFPDIQKYVGVVYAVSPFFAMLALGDTMRSWRYGMEELEMAAQFSLRSVVMIRMLVLGLGNMAVMGMIALAILPRLAQDGRWYAQFLYLMTPYLLMSGSGHLIMRKFRGRTGEYLCFLLALLLAYCEILLGMHSGRLYEPQYLGYWAIACLLCLLFGLTEAYRTLIGMGELAWN